MSDDARTETTGLSLSALYPHGPIVGHPKHDYYICGSCRQPLGYGPCPVKVPTQPNTPTFDSLLSDPTQQLDPDGVVFKSIGDARTEAVARIICAAHEGDGCKPWADEDEAWRNTYRDMARAVLASDWLDANTRAAVEQERAAWAARGSAVARAEGIESAAEMAALYDTGKQAAAALKVAARLIREIAEDQPDSTAALDAVKAEAGRAALQNLQPGRSTGASSQHDHWLKFNDKREVIGCQCGFKADPADSGWGDSVVEHLLA